MEQNESGFRPTPRSSPGPPDSAAFLLTQLGAHAANRFAARLNELDVTPPQVGLLRWIGQSPGCSQQELAESFGIQPSRVVTVVDELEGLGLAQRGPHPRDRRIRSVRLTEEGNQLLKNVGRVATQHEREITASLSDEERNQLLDLLQRLASQAELTPGVHPGYRNLTNSTSARATNRSRNP